MRHLLDRGICGEAIGGAFAEADPGIEGPSAAGPAVVRPWCWPEAPATTHIRGGTTPPRNAHRQLHNYGHCEWRDVYPDNAHGHAGRAIVMNDGPKKRKGLSSRQQAGAHCSARRACRLVRSIEACTRLPARNSETSFRRG